ncbi:putative disease resistance protein [Sesamum angolense]|uniref:Disease resistance protein n=1 Tax=Sesamum angolense TaxID=2727404 RepID=A0AAE1WLC6_9LAMI|nr:putative disease resistance protein [Sesamum angolense]
MAATAYAAVVSLRCVVEDILHHPPQRILLDTQHFRSLLHKITSFQHFLEDYDALPITSKQEAEDGLEGQLARACYSAEDIIESFVLDQILASSQVQVERILIRFSKDFSKLMQDVDSIEKKVMETKGKMGIVKDQQPINSLPADSLSRRLAPKANDTTTGLDSHLLQLKERLVGDEPKLQMVSIVGMGVLRKQEDSASEVAKLVDIRSKHSDDQQGNEKQEDSDAPLGMDFLDEHRSWNLFSGKVFLGEACPPELEEIGKQIAKSCKGLPLALVVIGGLLAKSQRTIEQWKDVAENLASIINLGNMSSA